jgi:hypothetical protein
VRPRRQSRLVMPRSLGWGRLPQLDTNRAEATLVAGRSRPQSELRRLPEPHAIGKARSCSNQGPSPLSPTPPFWSAVGSCR